MGMQGQILGSNEQTSHNNDENSSEESLSASESDVVRRGRDERSRREHFKNGGVQNGGLRSRKSRLVRYNSFCSSVYDEDARWKALNEDRPDQPCHKVQDSPFTTSSGFQNFRGLLNWCIIILVFTTGRAALENLIQYGVLINPIHWYHLFMSSPNNFPMVWVVVVLFITATSIYLVEKLASKWNIPEKLILLSHTCFLLFEISFPAIFTFYLEPSPFLSSPLLYITVTLFLKMVSYIQVNKWCREHIRQKYHGTSVTHHHPHKGRQRHLRSTSIHKASRRPSHDHQRFVDLPPLQHYPDNINIKDFTYFLSAPTVCYELNYPRSARVRVRFLAKRAIEIFFLLGLILSLVQQWILPILENSLILFEKMNYPMMVARILKLAVPNHFIWLIGFYFLFHSCCNFQAELLRFADRVFYKDWWNAENIQQFWSTWNVPIHKFARRHVYKRLLEQGRGKMFSNLTVFLLSALFHEYLFSVPLNMLRPWFFMSLVLQTPLMMTSDRLTGKGGNMVVWLMLILGQPLALIMYYHDYYLSHRSPLARPGV